MGKCQDDIEKHELFCGQGQCSIVDYSYFAQICDCTDNIERLFFKQVYCMLCELYLIEIILHLIVKYIYNLHGRQVIVYNPSYP